MCSHGNVILLLLGHERMLSVQIQGKQLLQLKSLQKDAHNNVNERDNHMITLLHNI